MTKGAIVIVEDDKDDQDIYNDAIRKLGIPNKLIFFDNGKPVLDYLYSMTEQPFIILSDINMPQMTGLELKAQIQADAYLREKGIPFIFISTNASRASVNQAHALNVQGYFEKPGNMLEIQEMLQMLFGYWMRCKHINNT
jgi:CheY-like chemotaxis protein